MDYCACTFPFSKGLPVGNFPWYSMSLRVYLDHIFTGHLLFLNFFGRKYSFIPTVEPYKSGIYLTFFNVRSSSISKY
jgi:hypothetical protein